MIYDISYKTFINLKPLRICFIKINEFIKIYKGIRYLVLFGPGSYDAIYNRIRYFIIDKIGITDIISPNFARIRTDLYNSLPIKRTLTFHNFIRLIKSVVNKNENNCFYIIFSEKGLCEDKSNTYFLK